jgi:hypothetical protein
MPTLKRFGWVLLVAFIIGFAFLIRVWNINKESFWADEGWTMLLSKGPTLSDVVQTLANDQHPPLYFILMHYWIDLTGNSEFATRFLSLMWSVIGVALIYRLGADCFSPSVGALAALMLALADNDTFLAQDARHYTQMAALATCSTLFYLRYYRYPSRINGIGWLLSSAALMYSHYLGVFILLAQLIHLLIFAPKQKRLRDMLFRWVAIWLAWLPWAFVFLNQSLLRYTRPIWYQSTWSNSPEALSIVRNDLIGSHFGLTGGLLLLGFVYVSYKAGIPKVRWRPTWNTSYLLLWLSLPIIIIIGINPFFPILTTRNFLIVTPVIWLLVGHGIMNLDRFPRALVLVILVVVSLITLDAYFVKPPWRQVALDILRYRSSSEPILMNVWTDDFALRYHIGRDLHVDPATLPLVSFPEWEERYKNNFLPVLKTYLTDKNSFWIAYWDKDNGMLKFLEDQGFTLTSTQVETHLETNKIYVYRFDRLDAIKDAPQFGDSLSLVSSHADQQTSLDGKPQIKVNMLWKVLDKPPHDYSISVFLLDSSGRSVANIDSPPLDGKGLTSTWNIGDYQFDSKTLDVPTGLAAGTYSVGIKVYWYVDQKPLAVQVNGAKATEYYVVGQVELKTTP